MRAGDQPMDILDHKFGQHPKQLLLGTVCALALSGCAVGPNFSRPKAPATDRYTETAHPVTGPQAQKLAWGQDVAGDWWTLFRSPALSQLVATALRDSPTLEASRDTLTQAQETTIAQQGGFLPSVSGQASHQREEYSGAATGEPGLSQTFSVDTAQLNVSYTFDIWGANRRAVEADAARADYQRFELEGAANMLAANTADAAINAGSLEAQIDAERALLGDQQHLLTTVQNQFNDGAATGADVAAQQTQVAQTAALLPPLLTELEQTRDQLADYLGQIPSQAQVPVVKLAQLSLPMTVPESLPSALVEQRPDIRAAEAQFHTASAELGVAIAARLPQITLTGAIASEAARPYQLFSPGTGAWNVLGQGLAPIFQGGTLLHQQRAANDALKSAAASYRAAVVGGFQNVADCLVALGNDGDELTASENAAKAAARSLRLAQVEYNSGSTSYQTVLTAEIQDQNATINVIKATAARYTDTVALFTALGGGWWNRSDAAPPPANLFQSLEPTT